MIEVKFKNFYILNLNKKRVLQDILLCGSEKLEDVKNNLKDILVVNNIQENNIEIYEEGDILKDDFLKKNKISLKEGYVFSQGFYNTIEEYNNNIVETRKYQYSKQIDPEIQALQTQLALKEITQKEYDENIKELQQKKQAIKEEFKKI